MKNNPTPNQSPSTKTIVRYDGDEKWHYEDCRFINSDEGVCNCPKGLKPESYSMPKDFPPTNHLVESWEDFRKYVYEHARTADDGADILIEAKKIFSRQDKESYERGMAAAIVPRNLESGTLGALELPLELEINGETWVRKSGVNG